MSNTMGPPAIPARTSSLANIHQEQRVNEEERRDLKRKISSISVEENPRPLKLLIDEALLMRRREELCRDELHAQREANEIDQKEFRNGIKAVARRIVSAGDELWALKKEQRAEDENLGKIQKLTPDSQGAFVATLLHLYKDPMRSSKRSGVAQKEFRVTCLDAYAAVRGDLAWCVVTGRYFNRDLVKAAHIVPAMMRPELVDYLFGTGSSIRQWSPDNALPLCNRTEEAFDNGNFALVPVNLLEQGQGEWQVIVIKESSRDQRISSSESSFESLTIGEAERKKLSFKSGQRPASRFLYFHYIVSLLRLRQFQDHNWQGTWAKNSQHRPFAKLGPYLRRSMLMVLANGFLRMSPVELGHLLGEPSIEREPGLEEDEEHELGRDPKDIGIVAEDEREEKAIEEDAQEEPDDNLA